MLFPLDLPSPEPGQPAVDLVVFDLIDVLVCERPRLVACLSAALTAADLPVTADDLAGLACQPIRPMLSNLVSSRLRLSREVARPLVRTIAEDFNERVLFSLHTGPGVKVRPGADNLLAELAAEDIHIGIDSELDGVLAIELARRAGWVGTGLFEAVVGSDEVLLPRPGPGQIEEIRRRCGLPELVRVAKVVGTVGDAQAALSARCTHVYSLAPDLVAGLSPVTDLGDLAERILGRDLV